MIIVRQYDWHYESEQIYLARYANEDNCVYVVLLHDNNHSVFPSRQHSFVHLEQIYMSALSHNSDH
jgi:hypothetical protein